MYLLYFFLLLVDQTFQAKLCRLILICNIETYMDSGYLSFLVSVAQMNEKTFCITPASMHTVSEGPLSITHTQDNTGGK